MTRLALIAVGGAAGSTLRYVCAWLSQVWLGGTFPFGTLFVNVAGCFLIGVCGAAFAGPVLIREEYRFAIMVGFLGGLTTFSTFGLETFNFAEEGQFARAAVNILLNNVLGLTAVWGGYQLAVRWFGVPS